MGVNRRYFEQVVKVFTAIDRLQFMQARQAA